MEYRLFMVKNDVLALVSMSCFAFVGIPLFEKYLTGYNAYMLC